MKQTAAATPIATVALAMTLLAGARAVSPPPATPVLVELFTSEGCSDCPPANKLLTILSGTQPVKGAYVVALGEHVDYFNNPWVDPFSSSQFTDRQTAYARAFRLSEPYTPEMVVDGRVELIGGDGDAARSAIGSAARSHHADVTVTVGSPDHGRIGVSVHVAGLGRSSVGARPYVFVALTEDGLRSDVRGGENRGRVLAHSAVVRRLLKIGPASSVPAGYVESVTLDPHWKPRHMHAVAFVQDLASGAVLGTGIAALE